MRSAFRVSLALAAFAASARASFDGMSSANFKAPWVVQDGNGNTHNSAAYKARSHGGVSASGISGTLKVSSASYSVYPGYLHRLPTMTATRTATRTVTRTVTQTNSPTPTFTRTATRTASPTPTATPTVTPTATPTSTVTPSVTETNTPSSTVTETHTPTVTLTFTATASNTVTPSRTSTPSFTSTVTRSNTPTSSATPTFTRTPTSTPTVTPTQTVSPSSTLTRTPTASATPTSTTTPTNTVTPSASPTPFAMLSAFKSADRASVSQGETITYTLIGTNSGTYDAFNITVWDTLDMSTGYLSSNPPYTSFTAGVLIWQFPSLNAGQAGTIVFSVSYPGSGPAPVSNRFSMSGLGVSQTDSNVVNIGFGAAFTATDTPTNTVTPSRTVTPSNSPSPSDSPSPTSTNTVTPSITPTNTVTPSVTPTSSATPSATPTSTETPSVTETNTESSTATETHTPTETVTSTETPSNTVTPSRTATPSSTRTVTRSNTPTSTATRSITPSATPTSTETPSATETNTESSTVTETSTFTETLTSTESPTSTRTATRSSTATPTITLTSTLTSTVTPTHTPTATVTLTRTATITQTSTRTATPTSSETPSVTETGTPSSTATPTATPTASITQTRTSTVTRTGTITLTASPTRTATETFTPTNTPTPLAPIFNLVKNGPATSNVGASVSYLLVLSNSGGQADSVTFYDTLPQDTTFSGPGVLQGQFYGSNDAWRDLGSGLIARGPFSLGTAQSLTVQVDIVVEAGAGGLNITNTASAFDASWSGSVSAVRYTTISATEATATPSFSHSPTYSNTPTSTVTPSITPSSTATRSATLSSTPSSTPTPSSTRTATASHTPTLTPTPFPLLSVLKSADVSLVTAAGDPITYVLSVSNSGTLPAPFFSLWDSLPANVEFLAASGTGSFSAGIISWSAPSFAIGTQNFTFSVSYSGGGASVNNMASAASLSTSQVDSNIVVVGFGVAPTATPSSTRTVTPSTTPTVTQTRTSTITQTSTVTGTVTPTRTGTETSTPTSTPTPQTPVLILVKNGPGSSNVGASVSYQLVVTNSGGQADNVTFYDTLPADTTFSGPGVLQGSFYGSNDAWRDLGSGLIARGPFSVGTAQSLTVQVDIVVEAGAGGLNITNTASALDPVWGVVSAVAVKYTTISATLATATPTFSHSPTPSITATVTPSSTETQSSTVTLTTTPSSTATPSSTPTVTQSATPTVTPSRTSTPYPALSIVKSSNVSFISTAGDEVTYVLNVTNNGNLAATNLSVWDTVPGNTAFLAAGGTGSFSAGVVSFSSASLAVLASQSFTFSVSYQGGGSSIVNQASANSVEALQSDSNILVVGFGSAPTRTSTLTATETNSPTRTVTPTSTQTATPTDTPSLTSTPNPTASATFTPQPPLLSLTLNKIAGDPWPGGADFRYDIHVSSAAGYRGPVSDLVLTFHSNIAVPGNDYMCINCAPPANNPYNNGGSPLSQTRWRSNLLGGTDELGASAGEYTLLPGASDPTTNIPDIYTRAMGNALGETIVAQVIASSAIYGLSVSTTVSTYILNAVPTPTPVSTGVILVLPTFTPTPVAGEGKIVAYPQPAKDKLCFAFHSKSAGDVEIIIYNAAFQVVARLKDKALGGTMEVSCMDDITGLAPGTYFYKAKAGDFNFPMASFGVAR